MHQYGKSGHAVDRLKKITLLLIFQHCVRQINVLKNKWTEV